jgi:lysophospholipase L1-like esterase
MRNVPVDSPALRFGGALDLEATPTGFAPRRLPAWTKLGLTSLTMNKMRSAIEAVVNVRQELGDENLHYLSGLEPFGADDAGDLPDHVHPNDAGNQRIAERFVGRAFAKGGPLAATGH